MPDGVTAVGRGFEASARTRFQRGPAMTARTRSIRSALASRATTQRKANRSGNAVSTGIVP